MSAETSKGKSITIAKFDLSSVSHEAGEILLSTNKQCEGVKAEAEQQCQALWDEMHAVRGKIVDIDEVFAALQAQCSVIRQGAKERCRNMRRDAQIRHQNISLANRDLAY